MDQTMEHTHPIIDDDPHFIINPDTRSITHASPEKLVLIQGDHNSERYTFEIPKTVDGHDMSLCNDVQIHFININGSNSIENSSNAYRADDFKSKEGDDQHLTFSWLISQHATMFAGALSFAVRFICRDANDKIQYVWNTAPFSGVTVSTGINNGDVVIEEYNDLLETWYNQLVLAGANSLDAIETAKNEAVAEAKNEVSNHAEVAASEYIERVKESISADTLDLKGLLVQEKGANPGKVMSQKVVTDELNNLESEVKTSTAAAINEARSELSEKIDGINIESSNPGYIKLTGWNNSNKYYLGHFDGSGDYPKLSTHRYRIRGIGDSDCVVLYLCRKKRTDPETVNWETVEHTVPLNPSGVDLNIGLTGIREFDIIFHSYSGNKLDSGYYSTYQIHYSVNGIGDTIVRIDQDEYEYDVSCAGVKVTSASSVYAYPLNPEHNNEILLNATGIANITKTGTNGLTDTYTISMDDGTSTTFTVQNGKGISSVERTDRGDLEDTYTVYFNDGESTTFKVPNGGSVGLKKTATGEGLVSIDDISTIEHGVKVKVKNKNLIPYPYTDTTKTINGITFTDNGDGSVSVSGTATAGTTYSVGSRFALTSKDVYTLSGCPLGGSSATYMLALNYYVDNVETTGVRDIGSGAKATLPQAVDVKIYIYIASGCTVSDLTFYPQLEEGSVATDYVPYVELATVKVRACGKNLIPFPYPLLSGTSEKNGLTITVLDDGGIQLNGTSTKQTFINLSDVTMGSNTIFYYSSHGLISNRHDSGIECSYDASNGLSYILVPKGIVCDNIVFYPQIEAGTVSTEYEKGTPLAVYMPSSDGTVSNVTSVAPVMNILTDAAGLSIEAEYNEDVHGLIEALGKIKDNLDDFEVVQEPGNGVDKVMSQKAVSEGFTKIFDVLPYEMRENIDMVYDAGFEQGALDSSGNETVNANRVRTGYIPVGNQIVASCPAESTQKCAIKVYNADKVYINFAQAGTSGLFDGNGWGLCSFEVDKITKLYANAKYIRVFYDIGDLDAVDTIFTYPGLGGLNGLKLDEVYGRTIKQPYKDYNVPFYYTIDEEGHYTKGFLKLPTNYTPIGEAVPLIVFVHASNYFGALDASNMVIDYYEKYYDYLRDCGYAIFDCYGWGNMPYAAGQSTWATPTNNLCYIKGIQYVCEQYNIDPENVFVTTKSLGGIQALSLCYQNEVKIKACGMLAPELDIMVPYPFGYSQACRVAIATDLGFTGDWESVLNVSNDDYDADAAKAYLLTQSDILARYNPIYKSVLLPIETKMQYSVKVSGFDRGAFRLCDVPIKIWAAPDDANVSYAQMRYLVETLKNAGCYGELRTMPEGTGGHQAVDRGENAIQTTDVTTRLGVHYDTIPTAYYELEQYFAKFAFKPRTV